jgi:hypothetical protein
MNKKIYMPVILGLLLTAGVAVATNITVGGTLSNAAPTVESVTVQSPTGQAPGTSFWVYGIINDADSVADISTAKISCYASPGVEFVSSWDSVYQNNGTLTWTPINDTAVSVNGTFTGDNYWSLKSTSATWNCTVYGKDLSNAEAGSSTTMGVSASTGFTLGEDSCVFDTGSVGTNKQWKCPTGSTRNETITHTGNVNLDMKISGTDLTGATNTSWTIGVGNITWKQATGTVTTDNSGAALLTSSDASLIDGWSRGDADISSATNMTAWLTYPNPLMVQSYAGTISITASP